jgi:hypothetical protein
MIFLRLGDRKRVAVRGFVDDTVRQAVECSLGSDGG